MKEQIEEMGKLCPFYEEGKCNLLEDEAAECNFDCDMCDFARTLYNAGYRKQKGSVWSTSANFNVPTQKITGYGHICQLCFYMYNDKNPHGHKFCPNCGAKMKGADNG